MILPKTTQSQAAASLHYDELDSFYREVWGEHVHHGYWATGQETPEEAAEALVLHLARALDLAPGQHVGDIGCGYGAAARLLSDRFDVSVSGVTISPVQAARGRALTTDRRVTIRLQDWLHTDFLGGVFDRLYAIESSEHMQDKARFFAEAYRTLKPDGVLVVCAWLAGNAPADWMVRHLLEPICREGRLPGMGNEADYRRLASQTGFEVVSAEDISRNVRRTWTICIRRTLSALFVQPRYFRFLLSKAAKNRIFALTMLRILIAYRTDAMRYVIFRFRK